MRVRAALVPLSQGREAERGACGGRVEKRKSARARSSFFAAPSPLRVCVCALLRALCEL